MIYFYYNLYKYISLQNGIIYPTYLFAGYSKDQMIDMCSDMLNEYDKYGNIKARIDRTKILSRKEGKYQIIKTFLMENHNNKERLDVFGDSMDDFSMLTNFASTKIRVLINRDLNDQTKEFKLKANKEYGKPDATYFVQGKDFTKSEFHL